MPFLNYFFRTVAERKYLGQWFSNSWLVIMHQSLDELWHIVEAEWTTVLIYAIQYL